MSEDIVQKDPLLSSKDAGKILGYTHDYISKLCRENKMNGVQKGRIWYVTESEVQAFKDRHEAELEAKKAELSQKFSEIRSQHETNRKIQPEPSPYVADIKKRTFVVPREFVAACFLGLLLLIPSFVNSLQSTTRSVASINTPVSSNKFFDSSSFVDNLDNGIATVIASQSELVSKTANTYGFVQYLSEGYWQLALSATQLSKGFYSFLNTISNGYLTLYVLQGHVILESFEQTSTMGAYVLIGYETLGQAVLIGTNEVIDSYSSTLNLNSNFEALTKKSNNFTANASEGATYAGQQIKMVFLSNLKNSFVNTREVFVDNISNNLLYMGQSLNDASTLLTATVSDAFSVIFVDKDSSIWTIKLNK